MVWSFLKKLGIKLPYAPAIPLLGIYPEETKTEKDTSTPSVHCSTVYNRMDREAWCTAGHEITKSRTQLSD